jgi:hypothetical protein
MGYQSRVIRVCLPIPCSEAAGQSYNTVGWVMDVSIVMVYCLGDRDDVSCNESSESFPVGKLSGHPEDQPNHPTQPTPPLALARARQVGPPAFCALSVGNCLLDLSTGTAIPGPISPWFQSMNGAALRTEQTSKIDTMRAAAKPGDNKSMPPQPSTAPGAARWFIPGVSGAETSNFLDGCGDKQYHKATPFRK